MNTIFLGSPDFALPSLNAMVEHGFCPKLVITQPPARRSRRGKAVSSPVGQRANQLGLPLLEVPKIAGDEVFAQIEAVKPDIAVVVAFGQILRKRMLELPTHGCINLHPSMLPKYRGAAPVNWAMIDGVEQSGVTIMRLVKALDAGPVLLQREFRIYPEERAPAALERAAGVGAEMLCEVLERFAAGDPPPDHEQDHEAASYAGLFKKEDGLLDFTLPAQRVWDRIRGVQPWPGAYAFLHQGDQPAARLILWDAIPLDSEPPAGAQAGQVVKAREGELVIACGEGMLRVSELQREGKARQSSEAFLAGFAIQEGSVFTGNP